MSLAPRLAALASAALVVTGCATTSQRSAAPAPPASGEYYTVQEQSKLVLCVAMADTALTVGSKKQGGVTREAAKAAYKGTDLADLANATVDAVYDEDVKNPVDYALQLFDTCVVQLAKLPAERSGVAKACGRRTVVAAITYDLRQGGLTEAQLLEQFPKFKSGVAAQVVHRVYEKKVDRGATVLNEWRPCIATDKD